MSSSHGDGLIRLTVPVSDLHEDSKPDLQEPKSLASTQLSELRRVQIRYPDTWTWDNQIKPSAPSRFFKSPRCLFRQHRFAPAGLLKPSRVTAVVYFQYREVAPTQIQILFLNWSTGHSANIRMYGIPTCSGIWNRQVRNILDTVWSTKCGTSDCVTFSKIWVLVGCDPVPVFVQENLGEYAMHLSQVEHSHRRKYRLQTVKSTLLYNLGKRGISVCPSV